MEGLGHNLNALLAGSFRKPFFAVGLVAKATGTGCSTNDTLAAKPIAESGFFVLRPFRIASQLSHRESMGIQTPPYDKDLAGPRSKDNPKKTIPLFEVCNEKYAFSRL